MSRYLRNLIIALIVIGVLFALDFVFQGRMINPYFTRILMLSGIAITLAVSLNLINGFTGQFSIGHAGFMAVGAYSSAYFSVNYGAQLAATLGDGKLGWAVALMLATIIGAIVAGLAGLIVGVPSLRLKGDYLAIVTLGFGQIIVVFLNNIEAVGGARGYSGIPIVKSFFWIFLIAVLTIVIVYNIVNSAFGRALISIREDELASEAMGVNTTRYKVMAFVISSAMAGAGGVLLAHFDGYLNPKSFEFIKSFEILIMIILGGLGSIVGSVLGAILLTVLPEALRGFAEYRMVIYSLLLIVLMITRPQGLLGSIGGSDTKLGKFRETFSKMSPAKVLLFGAFAGLIIGGIVGHLLRPLQEFEQAFGVSFRSSFNYLIAGAIIGAVALGMLSYVASMLAHTRAAIDRHMGPHFLEKPQLESEGEKTVGASKGVPIVPSIDAEDKEV